MKLPTLGHLNPQGWVFSHAKRALIAGVPVDMPVQTPNPEAPYCDGQYHE